MASNWKQEVNIVFTMTSGGGLGILNTISLALFLASAGFHIEGRTKAGIDQS